MKNELIAQPTPTTLIELALQKGVDTTQLKELMDLQERWEAKQAKKEFLSAMSEFQKLVPEIKKNRTANIKSDKGAFSYKFADLAGISLSIKDALNQCGLSYRWEFSEENNKLKCTCFISHRAGHTETSVMESVKDSSGAKNAIQQTGSTQTYLQRYTLIGALGLSTAEQDNDAKTSEPKVTELTKEELAQWEESIKEVKNKSDLTKLYTKNKKTVDLTPAIQALMKAKQDELKIESDRVAHLINDSTTEVELDNIRKHVGADQMDLFNSKKSQLSKADKIK